MWKRLGAVIGQEKACSLLWSKSLHTSFLHAKKCETSISVRTCFPRRDNFGTFSMSTSEGIQKPLLFIDGSRCNESDKEGTSSLSSFEQITPDEVSDVKRADFPKQKPWVPKKDIANLEDAQKPLLCTNASNGDDKEETCSLSSFEQITAEEVRACESVSDLRLIDFAKECPEKLNMSFAGCGFLGIYHLGVAKVLQMHGRRLLDRIDMFGGASAGALVATVLALKTYDPRIIQECVDWCLETAQAVHKQRGGLLNPSICLMSRLREFLGVHLPDDAHLRASGRVFISITDSSNRKNIIVSEYDSKEDLIECMLSSSYVPHITGKKAVKWKGKKYIDGGMTDNLPLLAQGRTILVTPFSGGRKDICPTDKTRRNWNVTINREQFLVTINNIIRGFHAFFPPKTNHLKSYYERGQRDAIRFLKREGMFDKSCENGQVNESLGESTSTSSLRKMSTRTSGSCSSLQYESNV